MSKKHKKNKQKKAPQETKSEPVQTNSCPEVTSVEALVPCDLCGSEAAKCNSSVMCDLCMPRQFHGGKCLPWAITDIEGTSCSCLQGPNILCRCQMPNSHKTHQTSGGGDSGHCHSDPAHCQAKLCWLWQSC